MHRIDHASAVAVKPAVKPAGTPGFYSSGDALKGIFATPMTADAANDIQENLCRAIEAAGIALEKGNGDQLLAAIVYLASQSGLPLGVPIPFIGSLSVVPANCVALMGQTVQRSDYPALTAYALGCGIVATDAVWLSQPVHRTKFSTGDGQATIRLPDLRGEAIYGADLGRGVRSASIGDWLAGDLLPHNHAATTDTQGAHVHAGTTDLNGGHDHGSVTGNAGAHNHANGRATRLLVPPYVGSITGSDTDGSGSEQAVGNGDSGDIVAAADHAHPIPFQANHSHTYTTPSAGGHTHAVTVQNAGGAETRQRGTGYIYIMRVR